MSHRSACLSNIINGLVSFIVVSSLLYTTAASIVITHKINVHSSEYWTEERMKNAKPRDLFMINSSKIDNFAVCKSDYNLIKNTSYYRVSPGKATGKVFFRLNGQDYVCSGSLGSSSLIWTAGHCAYDVYTQTFASNWIFRPGYYDSNSPYGSYSASSLHIPSGWVEEDYARDYALVRLSEDLEDDIHTKFTLIYDITPTNTQYVSIGYPQGTPFDGQWINSCNSSACFRDQSLAPPTVGIQCDSTGGSSGGPWYVYADTVNGTVLGIAGVNSYSYEGQPDVMYSPYFDGKTKQFFDEVSGMESSDDETFPKFVIYAAIALGGLCLLLVVCLLCSFVMWRIGRNGYEEIN
eukprot:TRINITY_DN6420_c0_g1_i5.p1 TRINITY_DN6420_c0_g1~~TRINITY_DN6420_c0_g1_i5.p1  ORF type:complete len:350 (+),score=40.54 TRINITY_DN6420_c0_g1_i5:49-1098(+)